MRTHLLSLALLVGPVSHAQQVSWLNEASVDYISNPGMPRHELASAPGHLAAMRMADVSLIYGTHIFGTVVLDALDPATGAVGLSCAVSDPVSVGAAAVSPQGIGYFTGAFAGDALVLCDGTQVPSLGSALTVNHFLLAWDLATGTPLWCRNLSIAHPNGDEVPSLAIDPDGHLWYLVRDLMSGKVVRVDAAGNDVEERTLSGVRRFGTLSFDPWGGLYVSGSCENGDLTFGGQSFAVESTEGYNMFVLRYRPDGTAGFAQFARDFTFTHPTVAATQDGHAYLAGDLNLSGGLWGGMPFTGTNWGDDVFIARLDSTGHFLWGLEAHPTDEGITGDVQRAHGPCIAVGSEGEVYFTGSTRGMVGWGNGVVSGGAGITSRRLSVLAIAPDGVPQWVANSAAAGLFVTAQTITSGAEADAVHFVAHTSGDLTYGPFSVNSDGDQAAVRGRIAGITTGVHTKPASTDLHAWPNPTTGLLHIERMGSLPVPADLMNSAGQRVQRVSLRPGRTTVDVTGLAPGLYLLRIAGEEALRVVVE